MVTFNGSWTKENKKKQNETPKQLANTEYGFYICSRYK